jgi:hypothetical protein
LRSVFGLAGKRFVFHGGEQQNNSSKQIDQFQKGDFVFLVVVLFDLSGQLKLLWSTISFVEDLQQYEYPGMTEDAKCASFLASIKGW